jgi:hypothetical protein
MPDHATWSNPTAATVTATRDRRRHRAASDRRRPQPLHSPVLQYDVRAHDQVPHGPGGQDLPRAWPRPSPRRDVHRDPTHVAVAQLDLAGVQPLPELKSDAAHFVSQRGRTADAPAGTVEGGQDPIASRLDQPPARLRNQPARSVEPTMSVNSTVASTCRGGGTRRTPVRNSSIRSRACSPGLPHQRQVGPSELDQLGVGEVLGQVAGVLEGDEVHVAAVQDQGRRVD